MPLTVTRRRIRIPLATPIGIETGWAEALVYEAGRVPGQSAPNQVAVHPRARQDDPLRWTVTLLPCGEGYFHLETEIEAKAFARELLISAEARGIGLGFDRYLSCPQATRDWLIGFCSAWQGRRLHYCPRPDGAPLDTPVLFSPDGKRVV